MQAVHHFLINGLNAPLMLFSPAFINGLDVDQQEIIAGEDILTQRRQQQLKKEIQSSCLVIASGSSQDYWCVMG